MGQNAHWSIFWHSLWNRTVWVHAGWFIAYVAIVLVVRSGLRLLIRRGRTRGMLEKVAPGLLSLVNWATFYVILIFILVYFSKSAWMFRKFFSVGKVDITAFVVIIAVLIISFSNRSAILVKRLMLPGIYERYGLDIGLRYTIDRVIHYAIVVIAVMISLNTVGINLSTLTVFAGVVGVGIGFGMQNIASNFISGLIILFEQPIKVGDRVIIQSVIGDVQRINMRATVVQTLENEHIIIPNSYFLQEQVVNRSYGDLTLRLTIDVGVSYDSDVHQVRSALLQAVENERNHSSEILTVPKPYVNFKDYGDSSLDFQLFVWISNPEAQIRVSSGLRFRIWDELSRCGIEIPFPQRDLHVRSIDKDILKSLQKHRSDES